MRIAIHAVDPETHVVNFSTVAGVGAVTWSGQLPDVGAIADVEIDLDVDLSHDNTTVVPDDTEPAIVATLRGVSVVAIVEPIDDDGMLFLPINDNSTVMVEAASDFAPSLGSRIQIETTVDTFRLTPIGSL